MPIRFAQFPERYCSLVARSPYSILLHTSRCDAENYRSYLFAEPAQIITTENLEDLPAIFVRIEHALHNGNFVAGFLCYECGEHFEQATPASTGARCMPLGLFGVYPCAHIFDHRDSRFEGEPPKGLSESPRSDMRFAISNIHLDIAEDAYSSKVNAIHEYIRSGESYQINLTDKLTFEFSGSPMALFTAVNTIQPVPYSAFINLGDRQILSFSPELFFRIRNGRIVTRPMKGTARRGRTLEEDATIAMWLKNDPKNRSENVMIVDLLRNDIGRICEFGSVCAEELFSVEKYDTLFQMTSTVSGLLRPGLGLYEIFKSVFPSGSVTGAPKIRAMQIIRQLERRPRAVYTGAIGFFAPGGESVFNVAIRTIVLNEGQGHGEMGVGSGITIDSLAHEEYRECLLKAEFLTHPVPPFALIETLLWDGQRYPMLDSHLHRLEDSARYFGFAFDRLEARDLLCSNARQLSPNVPQKVRLTLNRQGTMEIKNADVGQRTETGLVTVTPVRTSSLNRFLYHKTTNRQLYNESLDRAQRDGYDDVLFLNERGELTEGAINNVFVEIGGKLLTPPVASGLLPGVYRQHLLATNPGTAEKVLSLQELATAESVYICNAVRGVRKVRVVPAVGQANV